MLTMDKKTWHETTIRMDPELHQRLSMIAQVNDQSINALMVQAISESVMLYEGDPEYQAKRAAWLTELQGVGTT